MKWVKPAARGDNLGPLSKAILAYVNEQAVVTHAALVKRFEADGEALARSWHGTKRITPMSAISKRISQLFTYHFLQKTQLDGELAWRVTTRADFSADSPPGELAQPRQVNVMAQPDYVPEPDRTAYARPGSADHLRFASKGF